MLIEKSYYTVPEILERWRISEADLIYLAENDRLRLSVRVFDLPLEFGGYDETPEGERFRVPWEQKRVDGLLELHACDVFQLYRCGELQVSDFRTPRADYASLWDAVEPLFVMIGDLLIRREERDRFEAEANFSQRANEPPSKFLASCDYQYVRLEGRGFSLGPIQAQVVRALHEAAQSGEPWRSGKAILSAAGSRSMKMTDVFKSQPHWRELIYSNGRGHYRLNCD